VALAGSVRPDAIDNFDSARLARSLAEKIAETTPYPGPIQMGVIGQTRPQLVWPGAAQCILLQHPCKGIDNPAPRLARPHFHFWRE